MSNIEKFYQWMLKCGIDTTDNSQVLRAFHKIATK